MLSVVIMIIRITVTMIIIITLLQQLFLLLLLLLRLLFTNNRRIAAAAAVAAGSHDACGWLATRMAPPCADSLTMILTMFIEAWPSWNDVSCCLWQILLLMTFVKWRLLSTKSCLRKKKIACFFVVKLYVGRGASFSPMNSKISRSITKKKKKRKKKRKRRKKKKKKQLIYCTCYNFSHQYQYMLVKMTFARPSVL